jgi:spore maturation protein CgeB
MKIFAFGSSLTSSFWNGAATYYRGMYKSLFRLGHEVTFAEPDIYQRQQNRDLHVIDYAEVIVYQTPADISKLLQLASGADLVIKHSGVGAEDELLEREVLGCQSATTRVGFWDVDAPATLARVEANSGDPFRSLIPRYDFIFTYGGGAPVIHHYLRLGARNCNPIYNGLDPETHHPVPADPAFACDMLFVGHRLPDRERRVEEFFFKAAQLAPDLQFVLGGEGWGSRQLPENVRWIGHVRSSDHNRMNCSAKMVLNINRESMASVGFSPPTRVFEAAGAGACLISDAWTGIDEFFKVGSELLVAHDAGEVVNLLRTHEKSQCEDIGKAMRLRALREHTYSMRAIQFDQIVSPQAVSASADSRKAVQPAA